MSTAIILLLTVSTVSACRFGTPVTPLQNCTKFTDCNENRSSWCDDTDGICCTDPELWKCPDKATPLFNEKKCSEQARCKKRGGTCVRGHCCPQLVVLENSTVILGQYAYETEVPCDGVPPGFSYAFCNPTTRKLVVMGNYHRTGERIAKDGSKCTRNSDCSEDGSTVCVHENATEQHCYYNPLRERVLYSSFWMTIILIAVIVLAIFLLVSLIFFVFYSRMPKNTTSYSRDMQLIE